MKQAKQIRFFVYRDEASKFTRLCVYRAILRVDQKHNRSCVILLCFVAILRVSYIIHRDVCAYPESSNDQEAKNKGNDNHPLHAHGVQNDYDYNDRGNTNNPPTMYNTHSTRNVNNGHRYSRTNCSSSAFDTVIATAASWSISTTPSQSPSTKRPDSRPIQEIILVGVSITV